MQSIRQSAAKLLKDILSQGEGSTTIPRKGSSPKGETVSYYTFSPQNIPKVPCVYCIINKVSLKCYVGSTFSLKDRISRHTSYLKRGAHHSKKLQNSVNKYGFDSFVVVILHNDSCIDIEEQWIRKLNSVENGYNNIYNTREHVKYNLTSEQIKKAIQPKQKKVIILSKTGELKHECDSVSDAAKLLGSESTHVSKACKTNRRTVKGQVVMYKEEYLKRGFVERDISLVRSQETKDKISKAHKGRKLSESQIIAVNDQGTRVIITKGDIVHHCRSFKKAADIIGVESSSVARAAKKKAPCRSWNVVIEDIV